MRIYVDFDDVLCETAAALATLAREMFGRDVPYARIHAFDLRVAFDLDPDQYLAMMERAHEPDFLLALPVTPGCVDILRVWARDGHEIVVVTGRPSACHATSREWLRREGLDPLPVLYVDKYQRAYAQSPGSPRALSQDELGRERFDMAIEDSPVALDLLLARPVCEVVVFDRPWNRHYTHPSRTPSRCADWFALDRIWRACVADPPSPIDYGGHSRDRTDRR